jgi:thiol-disulfide isomerase/thioredoxin
VFDQVEEGEGELIRSPVTRGRLAAGKLLALAALAVLAAAACDPGDKKEAVRAPSRAPALATADLAAVEAQLAAGGGVRVVNFWAMWCQPCVAELPELVALDRSVRDRGVRVIGVSLDLAVPGDHARIETRLRDFLHQRGIAYENLLFTGNVSSLLDALDLPGSIPYTIIVAGDGNVIWRHEGATTRERIEAALAGAGTGGGNDGDGG